jgi:histone deacetylase complex regulatory component SIN3
LVVLLAHLLKWEYQPRKRCKSWQRTLIEQRKRIARLLRDSPSLTAKLTAILPDAYDSALRFAADETGMDETDFPPQCPYSADHALSERFYPNGRSGTESPAQDA